MNVFGREIIIDTKAGKILLESEIIKKTEYNWLKKLLEQNMEHTVKVNQLNNLEDKYRTFLTSSLYKELYRNASNEWIIDHIDESEEKLECSLCGQKDTKKKYYIRNKINSKILNVGSTCVNNFMDIRDVDGKKISEIEKEWKIQQRRKILNDRYPGIINKINTWNSKIDDIPTIINGDLEDKYDKLYNRIQELYQKFLKNNKIDYKIVNEINGLVCKGEEVLQLIYKDIDSKKNNEWYITKEIKDWCLKDREKNQIVLEFLKQDGFVKWRSACRIYERNLVNKIIQKLKDRFNNSDISIRDFNELDNTVLINIVDGNPYVARIDLYCPYSMFVTEYGNVIFDKDKKYTGEKEFVIDNSKILDDSSMNTSINNIRFLLNKSNIRIHTWDIQYNEIVFCIDNRQYHIINAKKFINNYIKFVFSKKLNDSNIKDIIKYVTKNGSKTTIEEYNNIIKTREKADKSMQVDYSKFV